MARKIPGTKKRKLMLVNVVNPNVLYNSTRMPALSLAYLSAYVPKEWDVRIVDETVERFDAARHLAEGPDIIGISGGNVCNIPRIDRMLEAIDEHRALTDREQTVVLGGYVGGLNLDGLPTKVDAVVKGPGELAIQQLLADFERGELQPQYIGRRIPMDRLKRPDFSKFNLPAYGKSINYPVQTSVSCNNKCAFCSARFVFGQGYEERPVEKVLEDMKQIPDGSRVYFTDPNLIEFSEAGLKRAKKLFTGMIGREFQWRGSMSFKVSQHDDILQLMKESGCQGFLIGYDSSKQATLQTVSATKVPVGKNLLDYYIEGTRKIQEKYGIPIVGTFVIGLETDDQETFANTIRVVKESKMDDAQFLDFTPLPGTPFYDQMVAANRIYNFDYSDYDFGSVVFVPQNLSPRELRNGVVKMYEECLPKMLALYRRQGLIRDIPERIRVESMKEKERREREERLRREGNGDH